LRRYAKSDEEVKEYYEKFQESKYYVQPPDSLYPFFYYDGKSPCLISCYIDKCYDFFSDDPIAELKKQLLKPYFKRYAFNYYLGHLESDIKIDSLLKNDTEETAKAIAALSEHKENLRHFVAFFIKYDMLINELIEYLERLYQGMLLFHKKNIMLLDKAVKGFYGCFDKVRKLFNITERIDLNKQLFSLCFVHRYAFTYQKSKESNRHIFIIGIDVDDYFENAGAYKHISALTFGNAIGTKLKFDIIEELRKGDKTISQLSKKLFVSRTTIDRFMQSLRTEMVVNITRKKGAEIYYALSPEYFSSAKSVIDKYIDDLLNDLC
jgi:DNA-binding HxlR family transcriptional regulator